MYRLHFSFESKSESRVFSSYTSAMLNAVGLARGGASAFSLEYFDGLAWIAETADYKF